MYFSTCFFEPLPNAIFIRYESLKYGMENKGTGFRIYDKETGELLGGKRAAIQFYYDSKYGDTADEDLEDGYENPDVIIE